jgi:hypothetical protein
VRATSVHFGQSQTWKRTAADFLTGCFFLFCLPQPDFTKARAYSHLVNKIQEIKERFTTAMSPGEREHLRSIYKFIVKELKGEYSTERENKQFKAEIDEIMNIPAWVEEEEQAAAVVKQEEEAAAEEEQEEEAATEEDAAAEGSESEENVDMTKVSTLTPKLLAQLADFQKRMLELHTEWMTKITQTVSGRKLQRQMERIQADIERTVYPYRWHPQCKDLVGILLARPAREAGQFDTASFHGNCLLWWQFVTTHEISCCLCRLLSAPEQRGGGGREEEGGREEACRRPYPAQCRSQLIR